jgi:urea carboxylase-associated protein 1
MPAAPEPSATRYQLVVPPGQSWSGVVRAGETLRITDLVGEQAVDTLMYCAHDTAERYDAQLTVLMQGGPVITRGTELYSSRARIMATVTGDTLGAHDTLVGCCSAEGNTVRFGEQAQHLHSCRDNFLIELAKHGMSKRDIVPNLNFFMPVPVEEDGRLAIVAGVKEPGHCVDLLAAIDLLFVISNCPQVNNPCNGFDPTAIEVAIVNRPAERSG